MGKVKQFRLIIPIIVLMGASSCYKEIELPFDTGEVFELSVTPEMQEFLYNSRDTSYTIDEPDMTFTLDDRLLDLNKIRTRGRSALRFQRKSFTVILKTTCRSVRNKRIRNRISDQVQVDRHGHGLYIH